MAANWSAAATLARTTWPGPVMVTSQISRSLDAGVVLGAEVDLGPVHVLEVALEAADLLDGGGPQRGGDLHVAAAHGDVQPSSFRSWARECTAAAAEVITG